MTKLRLIIIVLALQAVAFAAENYHISVKTVDTYRLRILKKLNLRNNADISRFAISHKLIEP